MYCFHIRKFQEFLYLFQYITYSKHFKCFKSRDQSCYNIRILLIFTVEKYFRITFICIYIMLEMW